MHVYLLQQVHEAGVYLGQEAQEEDEREAQGEHYGGRGNGGLVSLPAGPLSPLLRALLPPTPATSTLPGLTSGQASRAQKKKEAENSGGLEGDGRGNGYRASRASGAADEQTDAEVDGPAVRDHPVVALGRGL